MTILNKNAIPYLDDYETSVRKCSNLTTILNLDPKKQYWYVEFKLSLFYLPQVLQPEVLESIKKREVILVLANMHEAFHKVVKEIYDVAVDKLELPEENIMLVTESADILSTVKEVVDTKNKKEIKILWARIFERQLRDDATDATYCLPTLTIKEYDKKFLNFNRRWRLHRPLLVGLLAAKGLLDKGFVSLGKSDDSHNWNSIWSLLMHYNGFPYNQSYPEILEILEKNKEKIVNLPDMYLDTDDLITNRALITSDTDKYYSETYFSVVSETNFYTSIKDFEPGRFFSEKTFKPIFYKHPFILVGPTRSLDLLRELKYKTFSPYINETYDIEPNDFKRMLMIVDEIERLSNLKGKELEEFINNVKPICEYNFECLRQKKIETDFVKELN